MGRKSNKRKELEAKLSNSDLVIVLEAFADICNETRGCSFSILRSQRTRCWHIHLANIRYKPFVGVELKELAKKVGFEILRNRNKIKGEFYTMLN